MYVGQSIPSHNKRSINVCRCGKGFKGLCMWNKGVYSAILLPFTSTVWLQLHNWIAWDSLPHSILCPFGKTLQICIKFIELRKKLHYRPIWYFSFHRGNYHSTSQKSTNTEYMQTLATILIRHEVTRKSLNLSSSTPFHILLSQDVKKSLTKDHKSLIFLNQEYLFWIRKSCWFWLSLINYVKPMLKAPYKI